MTKEEATKILARMLEADADDSYMLPNERSAVLFALQDMNAKPEKPKAQPIYITDNGKIIPMPEPDPPKTWIRAAEINAKITEEVNKAVTEALKKEHDKRLLEVIREIVNAEFFREMVNSLVFAAEKRREGAKND